MEISNNCEEREFCLVAISLPHQNDEITLSQTIHTTDNEHPEDCSKTSLVCPPGTQLISLEDASEYFFGSQNSSENENYIGIADEVGETINYIVQDEESSTCQYYYAVGVPQDVVEELPEIEEEEQVVQVDDNQYVAEGNQECDFNVQGTVDQYDNDEEIEQLEESTDCIQSHVEQTTDTLVYSNGSVYLMKQHQDNILEHQDTHCDNVLQEYGYVFVNEEEEEGDEEKVDVETLGEVVSALKCVSCHFTTLDKSLLIQHHSQMHCCSTQAQSDGKKEGEHIVYVCGQCSVELPSVETCRQHMILEHKLVLESNSLPDSTEEQISNAENIEQNNIETINGNTVKEKEGSVVSSTIDEHLRQYWLHHGTSKNVKARLCSDRKIRCTMRKCTYRFSTYDKMEKHKLCHTVLQENTQPPYTCTECHATFLKWPQCSLHLHKNHNISLDIITCPLCTCHSTHSVRMMATHLQRHAEKEGNVGEKQSKRWYSKKICQICHKTYMNSKILNKHIKTVHYKVKPFKCNVCGHSTSCKTMLTMHMRQHTGEKPYACEFCPYRTGDHNTLHRHQKTHTKVRPYSCTLCPYRCIQSGALRAHIKSKHLESLLQLHKGNQQQEETSSNCNKDGERK